MPQPVEAIDHIADQLSVLRSHLPVFPEEVLQPGMQGNFALIGCDDSRGVAELVVKFHYNSRRAFTGSFPKRSRSGVSSNSFILTRKLTDSRPSMTRWS